MHLIAVIMAADTSKQRQADASSLLNYGFSSYTSTDVIKKDTQIAKVKVAKSSVKSVDIITASDYSHLSKKSDNEKIETKKKIKKKNAPIKKGDDAGYLKIIIDGEEKERIKLVYASDAPKASYGFVLKNLIVESLS
jgi:D-alanyl-D-alanine carboxypeptidase (penicillin-binding protein 5/6)